MDKAVNDAKLVEELRKTDEVKATALALQKTIDRITGSPGGVSEGMYFNDEFHRLMNFYNAVIFEAGLPMAENPFLGRMLANGIAMGIELSKELKGN